MALHKGGMVYKYVESSTPETDDVECHPRNSRICATYLEFPTESGVYSQFSRFGPVEYLKILTGKPVAYVKFPRASCAESAVEAYASGGEGLIGVKMAEVRDEQGRSRVLESALSPEDLPPRSRLFVVLSREASANPGEVEATFSRFPDFVSIRILPGLAFVKFTTASKAAECIEYFEENPTPWYRTITLAQPKDGPGGPRGAAGGF
eukprot:RCo035703